MDSAHPQLSAVLRDHHPIKQGPHCGFRKIDFSKKKKASILFLTDSIFLKPFSIFVKNTWSECLYVESTVHKVTKTIPINDLPALARKSRGPGGPWPALARRSRGHGGPLQARARRSQGQGGPWPALARRSRGPGGPWQALARSSRGPGGPRMALARRSQGPGGPWPALLAEGVPGQHY